MPLLWDVVATLGVGFERHDNPPQKVTENSPRIILSQPRPQRSVQQSRWLSHSVRGALSGALKRKRGLPVVSRSEPSRGRVYRIAEIADLAEAAQLIPPASGPVPSPAKVRRAKQSSSALAAAA